MPAPYFEEYFPPAPSQMRLAMRSLPWYLIGGLLFAPIAALPFTGGNSIWWYLGYFVAFDARDGWAIYAIPAAVGLLVWVIRQFFRAADYNWRRNRAH